MSKATEDYKAQARKRADEMNTSIWFRLKEGDNYFRVLPTPKSKKTRALWYEYNVHREVGAKKATVRCGKNMDGEGACYLCDTIIPKLRKKGQDKRAVALEARAQFVMQVAKVTEKGGKYKFTGPFLFSPSKGVATQMLRKVFGSSKRVYEDPKKGYNISLSRTGTGKLDTRYGILEADTESSAVSDDMIEKLKPFSEIKEIPVYDEAKQKSVYLGRADDDEDDDDNSDDDDDTPKKKKGKKSKADVDDDDDDDAADSDDDDDDDDDSSDDDDDDADDYDDDKPKKKSSKSKSKKSKSDDDDDDADDDSSDDDDDDDDDDAPPKKKSKKSKASDDDDEDDNDDDDSDDDDDDAPPKKKAKGKKSKSDDDDDAGDDDDSSDDDDDDDDDPKPPKKKGGKKSKDDDDDDDASDDGDDGDDDDDDGPKPPKKKPPVKKKK